MEKTIKKASGRPKKADGERVVQKSVCLRPDQWAALGDHASEKIRAALDAAGYCKNE